MSTIPHCFDVSPGVLRGEIVTGYFLIAVVSTYPKGLVGLAGRIAENLAPSLAETMGRGQ